MATAIAAATAAVLPVFLAGAMAVQVRHALHLGATDIGIAVAAFFGTSALCSVSFGAVAERIGPLAVMRMATALALASMLVIAGFARSLPSLAAGLAIGGLANGAMQPAVNLFLSRTVRSRRQGLAFGVKQAGIPTATLLSGLAVPALALTVGWEAGFVAGAALVTAVGVVLVRTGRTHPGSGPPDRGRPAATTPATATVPAAGTPGAGTPDARSTVPAATNMSDRAASPPPRVDRLPLAVLAVGMGAAVAAATSMGSFVVASAVAHGVRPALAGLLSALGSAVGLAARVGFGWNADRRRYSGTRPGLRDLTMVAALVTTGILGYLALASGRPALLVPGVLVAYGAGWGFNGLFNLAVVRSHPHAPARATGITQVGTYLGGMSGPLAFGFLVDHSGYDAAWLMCAALGAIGAVTMGVADRLLHRRQSAGGPEPGPDLAVRGRARSRSALPDAAQAP